MLKVTGLSKHSFQPPAWDQRLAFAGAYRRQNRGSVTMTAENETAAGSFELRPVIGLTRGLPVADLETLTIGAIRTHRQLVEKADQLFQDLPEEYKTGKASGGHQHLIYIEAMIEMHAQMIAVSTLIDILGYVPEVSVN